MILPLTSSEKYLKTSLKEGVNHPFSLINPLTMTEEELTRRLGIIQDRLDKVYKALNTTSMPVYVYIQYLKTEVGLDIEQIKG